MPGARSSISIKKIPVDARGVKAIETAGKGLFSKESQPAQRLLRDPANFRRFRIEKPMAGADVGDGLGIFVFGLILPFHNLCDIIPDGNGVVGAYNRKGRGRSLRPGPR